LYKNLEILNKETHKKSLVKQVKDLSFAKELINIAVASSEFYETCKDYPIFFAKDPENNWYASALLGYKENENVFITDKNSWEKNCYVPAAIRKHPFALVNEPGAEESFLAVDKNYLTLAKGTDAINLFDKAGNNTKYLNSNLNFLLHLQNELKVTGEFIKQLDEWELLEEKIATITTQNNEKYNINGFYVVNEEKFKHLNKNKKEDMASKNAVPLITAHLISLSNIQKLGNR
jgi:hypothetical protein